MFHTGAEFAGRFASLEGEGATARSMKFLDLADVKAKEAELKGIVKAWCDARDAEAGKGKR